MKLQVTASNICKVRCYKSNVIGCLVLLLTGSASPKTKFQEANSHNKWLLHIISLSLHKELHNNSIITS